MSGLPLIPPRPTAETRPFWDAAAQGKLRLPRCMACRTLIYYPRNFCPECGKREVTWENLSGHGTVYACTVVRRGLGLFSNHTPYAAAYVALEEGPRVLTNIVGCPPEAVTVGQPVEAIFEDAGEGLTLLRFRPRLDG